MLQSTQCTSITYWEGGVTSSDTFIDINKGDWSTRTGLPLVSVEISKFIIVAMYDPQYGLLVHKHSLGCEALYVTVALLCMTIYILTGFRHDYS